MRTLAVALLLASLVGCCSVVGTVTKPSPYVGVQLAASGVVNGSMPTPVFCAVDLPFSAVFDTVFLPFTVLVWAADEQQATTDANKARTDSK